MGCCYGAPAINGCEIETGNDPKPLVLVRYPDACKGSLDALSSQPSVARPPTSHLETSRDSVGPSSIGDSSSWAPPRSANEQPEEAVRVESPPPSTGGPKMTSVRLGLGITASSRPGITSNSVAVGEGMHSIVGRPQGTKASPDLVRLQYRELTPEDYELLCLLDDTLPKRGTSSENVVNLLPSLLARDCGATQCNICLCELQPQMRVARLPCQHVFHMECISKWLTQCNGKCPLCLVPIEGVFEDSDAETALTFSGCGMTSSCTEAARARKRLS